MFALQMSGGSFKAEFPDAKTGQRRAYGAQDMRHLRGDRISFVPQGAMSALNPVVRVIDQVMDALPPARRKASKRQIAAELGAFIERLDLPARTLQSYPHQLSGGMRQRMLIAMAAFAEPRVVFADEPTTALDVVVQRKILVLLRRLQREQANSLVIVSHDLGVHYQITDRIAILYAGKIVEIGPTERVSRPPAPSLHPGAGRGVAAGRRCAVAGRHRRAAAGSARAAFGLPFPHPLPLRIRPLRRRGTRFNGRSRAGLRRATSTRRRSMAESRDLSRCLAS